jgi:hypothetical protein
LFVFYYLFLCAVSGEWSVTPGARVVDPSREPTFDIMPDGKIVELSDQSHPGAMKNGVFQNEMAAFC